MHGSHNQFNSLAHSRYNQSYSLKYLAMSTRQELLSVIEQLPDEQLPSLLEIAQALKQPEQHEPQQARDIRAFLRLPLAAQQQQLEQQAAIIAPYFQPGSEDMEWVEAYVEDDNWDDE